MLLPFEKEEERKKKSKEKDEGRQERRKTRKKEERESEELNTKIEQITSLHHHALFVFCFNLICILQFSLLLTRKLNFIWSWPLILLLFHCKYICYWLEGLHYWFNYYINKYSLLLFKKINNIVDEFFVYSSTNCFKIVMVS